MNQPRPESRITNLENRTTTIEATLLELSSDTAEELKTIRQEMKSGFNEIGTLFDKNFDSFAAIETRLDSMQSDITSIKSTQDKHGQMLRELLDRLPPKN